MKYVRITRTVGPQTTIVFCQGEMGIAAVEELRQAVDPLMEDATLTSLVGADPVVRSAFQVVARLDSLLEFYETLEELRVTPPASPSSKPAPAGPLSKPTPTPPASRPAPARERTAPGKPEKINAQASPETGRRVLALLGGAGRPDRGLAAAFALPLPGRLLSSASFCHSA